MLRIDPEKIHAQPKEEEIFNHFIEKEKEKRQKQTNGAPVELFLEKGFQEVLIGDKWHQFTLTNSLLIRPSKSRPGELRIEVFESGEDLLVGKGAYSVVNKIKTTLLQTVNGKWIARNHHRVDKQQTVEERNSLKIKPISDEKIQKEIKFNNDAGIRSKLISIGNFRHTVMPLVKGIELKKFLDRIQLSTDSPKYIKLTIEQRINIILDLSHDLQCLHAIGMIHRDIKPENAIVDLEAGSRLIDFGLSKINDPNGLSDSQRVGSLRYMAPEQYEYSITSEKSDSYTFMKTVAQLLGLLPDTNAISTQKRLDEQIRTLEKLLKKDANYFDDGFNDIFNELLVNRSDECLGRLNKLKQDVYNTIVFSTRSDPDLRFSLDVIIERFEKIKMDMKFFRKEFVFEKGANEKDLITANSQGVRVRNEYFKFVKNKKSLSKEEWVSLIETGLVKLKDRPSVIKEFVDALGIKVFLQLDTKKSIIDKIELTHNLYDLSKEFFINNFFDQLESELLDGKNLSKADFLKIREALLVEREHWQRKHEKYRNSIDQRDIFNQKFFSKETEYRLLEKFDKPASELKDAKRTGLTLFEKQDEKKQESKAYQEEELSSDEICFNFTQLGHSPGLQ